MDMKLQDIKIENNTDTLNHSVLTCEKIKAMNVESLAGLMLSGNLPKYKYDFVYNQLTMKLSEKAHQGWVKQQYEAGKTFEELANSEKYSGDITTKALIYALKDYGRKDDKTGERIPFEKLYWAAFGLKNRDHTTQHLNHTKGEEQKAKGEELRQLVKEVAEKNYYREALPRVSLLKKENLLHVLELLGASEEEVKKGLRLLEDSLIFRDACLDEYGEESGGFLSDNVSVENFFDADTTLDTIVGVFGLAFSLAKTEKENTSLLCLTTLWLRDYIPSGNYASVSDIKNFVDRKLLYFANHRNQEDRELLMEYLGVKDRELRRRLAKAKELLNLAYDLYFRTSAA